jgi:hypothetical protein
VGRRDIGEEVAFVATAQHPHVADDRVAAEGLPVH